MGEQRTTLGKRVARTIVVGLASLSTFTHAQAADLAPETEARFANGDVELAGSLLLPTGQEEVPGIVVMHGSGPETRTPYLPDARMLARHGYAALVFDKRGTGASSGTLGDASLDDLALDGLAAVRWLRAHPRVRPHQVGVLGVSQGGWLAPFMAAKSRDVAFLVQITAAATPLATQEMWGSGNALASLGYSDRAIRTAMNAYELLYSTRSLVRRGILPIGDVWFDPLDPWRDPAAVWPDVDVPALILFGGRDASVPTDTSRTILSDRLDTTHGARTRIVVFENAVHALGGPPRNQDPAYVATVIDWLQAIAHEEQPPPPPTLPSSRTSGDFRWYGPAPVKPRWHASAWVHLPWLLVLTLASVMILVASAVPPPGWGLASRRVLLAVVGMANLALVTGLGAALTDLLRADAASLPPPIPLRMITFSAALAGLGAAIVVTFTVVSERRRTKTRLVGAFHRMVVPASWAGVALAAYWGLLAGPL